MTTLFEAFATGLGDTRQSMAHRDQIEAAIADGLSRGAAEWPGLTLEPVAFAAALGESQKGEADPIGGLTELRATDLYLAVACSAGDPLALVTFERAFASTIEASLRALGMSDDAVADVAQDVRTKLFVGAPGKIATYSGRASLRSWLRTIATRTAINVMRRRTEGQLDEEVMNAIPSPADGPEEQHFRATYQSDFKAAFEAAIHSLTPQQRNLLRQRFVDGLAVDAIGALYGVHKATASRWIESARALLAKRTHNAFQQQTRATPSEMRSIVRILESNVELSLRRVLAS